MVAIPGNEQVELLTFTVGGSRQSSVSKTTVAVTEPGQPGVGTVYTRLTVLLPVPVKVKFVPDNDAGPVTENTPPLGSAVTSIVVPLQYKPPGLNVGVPVTDTSTDVAPQINTTAVVKV